MVATNGSIHKCEASWDDVMAGRFPSNPAREVFRQAVDDVAAKAKAVLTESHGRIDQAVKLVLAGDVQLHDDGTATVASQSNGQTAYHVNGECKCKDFHKAPANFCKHRLAFGIAKRATSLMHERLAAVDTGVNGTAGPADEGVGIAVDITPATRHGVVDTTTVVLPEAPASCNVHVDVAGRKVQITLRDMSEQRLLERLAVLLAQFPTPADPAPSAPQAAQPTCRYHGTQKMTPSRFGKHAWICSVKLDDDSYCNQRWPRKGQDN
jgi:hypothetical protein